MFVKGNLITFPSFITIKTTLIKVVEKSLYQYFQQMYQFKAMEFLIQLTVGVAYLQDSHEDL